MDSENQKYKTPWEHPDIAGIIDIFDGKIAEIKHKDMVVKADKEDMNG